MIKKQKVFLAEDDLFLQKVIKAKLLKEGLDVVDMIDGNLIHKAIKKEQPNVVLLDVGLPNKTGFEILQQIKKDKTTKHIPVIMFTKLGDEQDRLLAESLGASQYLWKMDTEFKDVVNAIMKELGK